MFLVSLVLTSISKHPLTVMFDSYFYCLKSSPKQGFNHFCSLYKIYKHNRIQYLLPKNSMISPVRVDLFLFSKASDAAFLIKADPAMLPSTVGLFGLFNNCKIERNKPLSICQAWGMKEHKYPKTSSNPMSKSKEIKRFQENHITWYSNPLQQWFVVAPMIRILQHWHQQKRNFLL